MQNALSLLELTEADEILPFSEDMAAGRLVETIKSLKIN